MDDRLKAVAERAEKRFGEGQIETVSHRGELTLRVGPDTLLALLVWARDEAEPRFAMLTDVSGVDGLNLDWEPRFRVSYHLLAHEEGLRLRVQADAAEDDEGPVLPSAAQLW